eukprot:scaffold1812_cov153-Skeletonema_menzelii.AAC.7
MQFRTPPKEDRAGKADPPGTPATALLSAGLGYTSSAGSTLAEKSYSPTSNTSIPSAFQTLSRPPHVKPRTARNLFPQTTEVDKPVIVWDIEAGPSKEESRETHTLGDSSGEQAVISPELGRKRSSSILTAEVDVLSDPGHSSARSGDVVTSKQRQRAASDAGGPASSTFKHTQQRSSAGRENTQQRNDALFPQTAEEHRARITALLHNREERQKRKKKKKQSRHGDSSGSVVSGASTDTYESIKKGGDRSPYTGYLKAATYDVDKKFDSKKKNDETSSNENSASKVSSRKWKHIEIEKEAYSRPNEGMSGNVKEQESEPKKNQQGSIASGTSSSTRKPAKDANYAVDKQFTSKATSKPASDGVVSSNEHVPQSADEHKARLKEIMRKREMKNSENFKAGDETSSISGISSKISGISSGISGVSSKSPSKVPRGTKSFQEVEKKHYRATGDKSSNVGSNASSKYSHVSGASSTTSSIFAASRAKLKGYLTSYSRKKRNRKEKTSPQTNPNTQDDVKTPLLSSARNTSSPNDLAGPSKPETLLSIGEMESLEKFPDIVFSTPKRGPGHSPLNISPLKSSPLSHDENVTRVTNLPWWMDKDGDQIGEEQIGGYYTGPINEYMFPHGKGELLVMGTSCQTFHGTWKNGKLVTPLTDLSTDVLSTPLFDTQPEPVTEDEESKSSSEEQWRGGKFLKPTTSTKYAINKNYTARANLAAGPNKAANKSRKPKPLVRYNIGDACRTPQDMIICSSKQEAKASASQLNKWDGAFIKRSCGVWTYAILIERAPQPLNVVKKRLEYFYWATVWEVDPRDEVEDSMLFAIDDDGSTKIIPERIWAKYVRRLNPNPVPKISKPDQENQEIITSKPQPSHDTPITRNDSSTIEPTSTMPIKEMLKKRSTEETRTSSDELHTSIEDFFEEEFGKVSRKSDAPSVRRTTVSTATKDLLDIVDSERGSVERSLPQVYEYMSDTETERASPMEQMYASSEG